MFPFLEKKRVKCFQVKGYSGEMYPYTRGYGRRNEEFWAIPAGCPLHKVVTTHLTREEVVVYDCLGQYEVTESGDLHLIKVWNVDNILSITFAEIKDGPSEDRP